MDYKIHTCPPHAFQQFSPAQIAPPPSRDDSGNWTALMMPQLAKFARRSADFNAGFCGKISRSAACAKYLHEVLEFSLKSASISADIYPLKHGVHFGDVLVITLKNK